MFVDRVSSLLIFVWGKRDMANKKSRRVADPTLELLKKQVQAGRLPDWMNRWILKWIDGQL